MTETLQPAACLINIGPRERRKRLIAGVISLGVSAAIAVALIATGAHRWWRIGLFLPLASAASGYFQARDKT